MLVMGIDTSCDETSAGVVLNGKEICSNVVHSQVSVHHSHGGVVPELASREHLGNIMPVVDKCLSDAGIRGSDLDAVAVTVGPGLVGSLLVGLYYAKALTYAHNIPLVAVNHLEGHILSIFLEKRVPDFPFVALAVSGGHTSLYHVRGLGQYEQLGQTLDDAAGEAFDKVAKVFGLGYPGGVVIEGLAARGDPGKVRFPRAYLSNKSLDFSFSGLKTAVALYMREWRSSQGEKGRVTLADVAASFQESVVDVLVQKLSKATEQTGVHSLVASGGVACNKRLRERLRAAAAEREIQAFFPRPALCTDNGAMIALAGHHCLLRGERANLSTDVNSRYPIFSPPRRSGNLNRGSRALDLATSGPR